MSFTQLVGTTTVGAYPGSFCDLSQNNSSVNVNLGKFLINQMHRFYLQKYFDNERLYTTITVGGENIELTSSPTVGSVTGTLPNAWPYQTCQQLVVFVGSGEQRTVTFTQNSTTIMWDTGIFGEFFTTTAVVPAGATSATLSSAWEGTTGALTSYFSDGESKSITYTNGSTAITWVGGITGNVEASVRTFVSDTSITTQGVQSYPIPANVSKIKNDTITVGQLVYTPAPVQSIAEWTRLNALPYSSDIPNYYFIYNNQVNFWPIPSTTGNIISFNYKSRVPDMTYADYAAGTITVARGSNVVTGSSTDWISGGTYPQATDLSFNNLMLRSTPPKGDGYWYPIQQFTSGTALLLNLPVVAAPTAAGQSYIIGQFPLLHEDFHPLLVYAALCVYYASIVKDKDRLQEYTAMKVALEDLMKAYLGTKSVESVDLGAQPVPNNPNLYTFYSS